MIVYGADHVVAEWVKDRIPSLGPEASFGPGTALGVFRRRPVGGCVFSNYQPSFGKIEVTWAGRCTRDDARELLRYPFKQLGVNLLWAAVMAENWRVIRMAERLGFQRAAGEQRDYFGPGRAAVILSMTRAEWLSRHERLN